MTAGQPDGYAARYSSQYEATSFETRLVAVRRRHVLRWFEQYRARRILEVGCGLEPLFTHYATFDAWLTVEPIAGFATRAQELGGDDARIQVREGYLESEAAALTGEDFDFIVLSSVVHELADPGPLLSAVHSLCSATTLVHVNVPNMRSFHRLLALEMGLIGDIFDRSERDRAFGHHGQFDQDRLNELLNRAGFRVIESGSYFVKPFTHDQMDALLETNAFPPSLIDGLDRMAKYIPEHGCELYANVRRA